MFRYYLRLGALSIRANPALSALMIAAIAIGIGACMSIVTIRYIMSGNPIPEKSEQLYYVQVDNWDPSEVYYEPNEPPDQLTYLDATALYTANKASRQVISFQSSRVVEPAGDEAKPFQRETRATTLSLEGSYQSGSAAPSITIFPSSVPFSRKCRVSARVSTPWMPGPPTSSARGSYDGATSFATCRQRPFSRRPRG